MSTDSTGTYSDVQLKRVDFVGGGTAESSRKYVLTYSSGWNGTFPEDSNSSITLSTERIQQIAEEREGIDWKWKEKQRKARIAAENEKKMWKIRQGKKCKIY